MSGTLTLALACGGRNGVQSNTETPQTMRDVPAVRLNYRYEPDVPPPAMENTQRSDADRNAAVQADFDNGRSQELLDGSTITSPDKKARFGCLSKRQRSAGGSAARHVFFRRKAGT